MEFFGLILMGLLAKSVDNGITWEIFEGQSIRENYCLGVSQSNHFRSITGSQDNGTSIKNENNLDRILWC